MAAAWQERPPAQAPARIRGQSGNAQTMSQTCQKPARELTTSYRPFMFQQDTENAHFFCKHFVAEI
jgi:hypothetical protein